METQAQPRRQNRVASRLARPWVTRLLATIGVVLMLVGFYAPFAGRDAILYGYHISHFSETWTLQNTAIAELRIIHRGRFSLTLGLIISAIYSVLTLSGLALIPLLWRSLSTSGARRAHWIYGAWLLLTTALAVNGLLVWRYFMSLAAQAPSQIPTGAGPIYLMSGAILFPLGLLLSCIALPLMRWATATTSAPRTGWQWASTLSLTAGMIVWLIGFYLMPEAVTAVCPPVTFSITQFAHGACGGLDSDQVLTSAYSAGLNTIATMLYALGRRFDLLVAIGGITMLGGWTRQLSAQTLVWLAAWPALAFGVALVALQGVNVLARNGFALTTVASSGWHVAAGLVVTFVGIVLVALGQLGLWREMVKRKHAA